MALALATDSLAAYKDLLSPGVWGWQQYAAESVKDVALHVNYVEDDLELIVRHRLFFRSELEDGSYKLSFCGRVERMILADEMPNGRRLTVERRSFLARAARVRKAKPKKAKQQ